MGGAIINHLIFCLLQRPVIGNVVKQSQFLNRTPVKFHPNETSMPTIASKENVNNQPCEFHQTNNLDKLFTDETNNLYNSHIAQFPPGLQSGITRHHSNTREDGS
jgi:hypothetical protein